MSNMRRVGLVTGGSRGLGLVVARVLAARGHDVVIGARDAEALEQAQETLSVTASRVVTVAGDITEAAVRQRLIEAARTLGGLDVLVNNASELGGIGPLTSFEIAQFGRIFPVNVGAPIALVQLAAPLMRARRGLIVNVSSDAAVGAYAGWGPYGASKAALELLTRTLAAELQPEGIAAVVVDPGDMRTRMQQQAFPGQDISDRPLPDVTAPFWHWLFDQDPAAVTGRRFEAQKEQAAWQQPA